MTYEQAIHELKRDCWYRTAECDCLRTCKEDDDCHIKTAMESVEKQIPTKPEYIPLHTFQCSVCKNPWLRWEQVHCDRCGTKLDWTPEGFAGDAKIIEIHKRSEDK